MTSEVPVNRSQMWLARGVICALVVLFILLQVCGSGSIARETRGNVTVYSGTPSGPLLVATLGTVTIIAGVVYWLQPGAVHRIVSVALFGISAFILFNAPTGWNHRVTIGPDSFSSCVGAWYAPHEITIDFNSLACVQVVQVGNGPRGRADYVLRCWTKSDGEQIDIPINAMMKEALPDILDGVARHEILIAENEEGWRIPPELRK